MSLVLARIDQRLVHGQVCVGWVPVLDVARIVVADDALADDAFEREILADAAPDGTTVEVLGVDEAVGVLSGPEAPSGRALLLVRSPAVMLALVDAGLSVERVNVGGLHYRDGARRFLDYVFLTPEDIAALRELAARGIALAARDLPGSPEVALNPRLASGDLEYDRLPAAGSR
jgi:mannose/fructose/N-acetylgalactosamine-specific phosphotransferase system component IIB